MRNKLYIEIKEKALAYKIISISNEEIDRINILEASRKVMEEAIKGLDIKPDYILADYMDLYHTDIPYLKLAHGDALSATIAAASILAKVERDNFMVELDKEYPEYGFKDHKGYPTKSHIEAIKKYGITKFHRKSYKPVKELLVEQLTLDL